jgi:hypothetical protein
VREAVRNEEKKRGDATCRTRGRSDSDTLVPLCSERESEGFHTVHMAVSIRVYGIRYIRHTRTVLRFLLASTVP